MKNTYARTKRAAIDLSLSENPLGPSPKALKAIKNALRNAHIYPEGEEKLVALIAQRHGIPEESVLLGAGANELLEDYLKVFALGKNIVVPAATFPESVACMDALQGSVTRVPLEANLGLNLEALLDACRRDTSLIHLCNPNNPTGIWTEENALLKLAECSPVPLLISEAGADFVGKTMIARDMPKNCIIVRSLSKAYGLAGLRVGYSVAAPEIIAKMKSNVRSYRVNALALAAAIAAIEDQEHLEKSIAYCMRQKKWLMRAMRDLGFLAVPSEGQNFVAKVPESFSDAAHFCKAAKRVGIAVVDCSLYPGMSDYIRISPQKMGVNKKFILILKTIGGK